MIAERETPCHQNSSSYSTSSLPTTELSLCGPSREFSRSELSTETLSGRDSKQHLTTVANTTKLGPLLLKLLHTVSPTTRRINAEIDTIADPTIAWSAQQLDEEARKLMTLMAKDHRVGRMMRSAGAASLIALVAVCAALAVAASSNEAVANIPVNHPGDPVIPPSVPAIVISEKRQK